MCSLQQYVRAICNAYHSSFGFRPSCVTGGHAPCAHHQLPAHHPHAGGRPDRYVCGCLCTEMVCAFACQSTEQARQSTCLHKQQLIQFNQSGLLGKGVEQQVPVVTSSDVDEILYADAKVGFVESFEHTAIPHTLIGAILFLRRGTSLRQGFLI